MSISSIRNYTEGIPLEEILIKSQDHDLPSGLALGRSKIFRLVRTPTGVKSLKFKVQGLESYDH